MFGHQSTSPVSLDKGFWSIKDSMMGSGSLLEVVEYHHLDTEPRLEEVDAPNSHIQIVANYKNDRLLKIFQTYNKKAAAKTRRYVKSMDRFSKPHKSDRKNPIAILRLLNQLSRACGTNNVSKLVAWWTRPTFMNDECSLILTV